MNGYFGAKWPAPLLDGQVQVETPVGKTCLWCEEKIVEGDRGLMMTTIDAAGKGFLRPIHKECNIRMSLGSVAHLEQRCSCYIKGSKAEDPPGLTKREAAIAAEQTAYLTYGGVKPV